ncbi:hypothetical protein ACF08M_27975 [Streptomyces sp. NPDC015032]|uniref:hypothetical protein n=1 Tax=Streptomyces sp. NPDC015032 TaxID=3364937 RepID=UPI0036FAB422
MNRRRISAAALLSSAVVTLTTVCALGTSASAAPAAGGDGGTIAASVDKPCYHPAGYDHFLKLESAEADQGDTRLNVTEVSCTVDPDNEEDVRYTTIRSASMLVHADAEVQVISDTGAPRTVQPGWLVDHKLSNSPYFYYRADTQDRITAMQEIYHP